MGNDYPVVHKDSPEAKIYLANESIIETWFNEGEGSSFRVNTIYNIIKQRIFREKKDIKKMKLFNASINLPYKEGNSIHFAIISY